MNNVEFEVTLLDGTSAYAVASGRFLPEELYTGSEVEDLTIELFHFDEDMRPIDLSGLSIADYNRIEQEAIDRLCEEIEYAEE